MAFHISFERDCVKFACIITITFAIHNKFLVIIILKSIKYFNFCVVFVVPWAEKKAISFITVFLLFAWRTNNIISGSTLFATLIFIVMPLNGCNILLAQMTISYSGIFEFF